MMLIPNTIRGQIMTAFLSCFVFMGIIIALNYSNFRSLSRSMQFFEIAEELNKNLLEMRRYEKNYFLYRQGFNYEENVTYANQLALTLQREHFSLVAAIGQRNYENFVEYVNDYDGLMARLHQSSCEPNDCASLKEQIRGVGQNLMVLADQLVTNERHTINHLLQHMFPLPLISLLFLVILLGFVIFFIGEKVIRPLARITRESEAVAQGMFQRITPYGGYKNEIHLLVSAINRMMDELQKRQEQLIQSRKIASIGTLTAGIAHEINNPINNLSLTLEALIEDGECMDTQERQQLYQEAMDQADRTSEIVKNLLEFSRASHPKVEYINLEELVDKTARLLNNEMKLNNIRFVKQISGSLPRLRMDKGGLQQVLLNLFINSLQVMGNDGELKVVLGPAETPGEIRIDVIDSGPGIPEEFLGQVFDPFFTTKQEGEGTGLGLSVSYTIIKKNGGRMEVKSPPGEGACFSIILPTNIGEYSGTV
jgi:two-component system, NtrC family, sensor kinase